MMVCKPRLKSQNNWKENLSIEKQNLQKQRTFSA
jgi:hypothetical protein